MEFINKSLSIISKDRVITSSDLIRDIEIFGANVAKRGIIQVELYLSLSSQFIIAFLGSLRANAKVYLLPSAKPSGAMEFINDDNFLEFLAPNALLLPKRDYLDSIFYIATSGSSKNSEIIAKSINQMILESRKLGEYLDIKDSDIIIGSVSHQHLYGLSFKIFLALFCGCKVYDEVLAFPEYILDYASSNKNLILLTSPALLKYLIEHKNLSNLRGIKMLLSAGSRLDSSIRNAIRSNLLLDIFEIYGSTESGIVAFNKGEGFIPFSDVNLGLDSNNRLIISSPWQKNHLNNDNFISNDCARLENGKLYLLGRLDRIVKIHDKRINLDTLSLELKRLDIISDCFLSVINNIRGEVIAGIIVLSKSGRELFKESGKKGVVQAIRKLGIKEIKECYIRQSLPYNQQGKLTRDAFLKALDEKISPSFSAIKKYESYLIAKSYISEDCFYFDGHFSNFPLVPGFIELSFVIDLAKEHLGLGDEFNIESVKFSSFLRPFDNVEISIEMKNSKIYFSIFANEKECANGRILPK